ncbi:hypothetical protein F1734_17255 [Rhodococcus ruber]|uniref:hypothetical protein n=1 Tax=Rhodococcus ruber TaxID=1830 RepID=UPI000743C65F|nr:hypothetical protein [Rhodococcus ruber]QRE81819.1 hypothetical protein F1734_17255 [Rhodococcus ruber]
MTPDEIGQQIVTQAGILAPSMYEGVSLALEQANSRMEGFPHKKYPHMRPMVTRAALREYLEKEGLPPEWQVAGNPQAMGQLYFSAPELNLKLRFLKERRKTYPGGVPIAGKNAARQKAWSLFSEDELGVPQPKPSTNELLLLWDYAKKASVTAGFTLRIVRPIAPGIYGKPVPYDLDIALRAGGNIFTNRTFAGDSDDEDFFGSAEIDRAENDDE